MADKDNSLSDNDPRSSKNDYVTDADTKKTQAFTKKPGVMDYFKEAFSSDNTRAQLEAIRNARAKAGSGY